MENNQSTQQVAGIIPSKNPLVRYNLQCPSCNENEVYLPAGSPEEPYCKNCDEEIDVDSMVEFVIEWTKYLRDREALLQSEKNKVVNE